MDLASMPCSALAALLEDAVVRDATTARRAALVKILMHERFLTREQLIHRVEGLLGSGCFGTAAWADTFFRDMRVVKACLKAVGHRLAYSRRIGQTGYYLTGQGPISSTYLDLLRQSAAEVDPAQIHIFRRMEPAERFRLGCSVTDGARDAVAYRLGQRDPRLSLVEASCMALQGPRSA